MAMDESKAAMFLNLGIILSLLLLISMADAKQDSNEPICKTGYEVKSGDTCDAICQAFNLTQSEFQNINPNVICDKLSVHQLLCVAGNGKAPTSVSPPASAPQKPVAPENPKCKTEYTVQSGDTCYAVWTMFNLTEKEFRDVNPKVACEKLVVGQSLCIDRKAPIGQVKPPSPSPQGSPAPGPKKPKCKHFYKVQDGDTCYAIWQQFHLLEEKFKKNNPRAVCNQLDIGQKLCVDG